MNRLLFILLLLLPATSYANPLSSTSTYFDVLVGTTDMDTPGLTGDITIETLSLGLKATKILFPIAEKRRLYFGVSGGAHYHSGDDDAQGPNSTTISQDYETYSASIGPAIYWGMTKRLTLYTSVALSYSSIDLETTVDSPNVIGRSEGSDSGISPEYSFGARFAITKSFNIGVLYQINNLSFDYDYDFTSLYTTLSYNF